MKVNLDDALVDTEAAAWLKMSVRELREKSQGGKHAPIFACRLNRKTTRWVPRIVLAKLMRDGGLPESLIAAAMNLTTT